MAPAQRELTFLLADPERRLLRAIAARLPQGVTSDHLTVLGMFGALGVAAAYALSRLSPVARVRGAERPRYGYYLDHVVDAGSTALIGLGLGLSPYVNPCVALGVVIVYLALSINVYLEANVFAVFRLAYSRLGPTEVRILLIAVNAGLAVSGPGRGVYLIANATLALLGICMLGMLGVRVGQNLSRLAREEPLKRPARQLSPRGVAALS